jgi:hypothetical protein
MNRHERIDGLVAAMGGLYGEGMKFFREGGVTLSPFLCPSMDQ